jgi:hypothetical protein
MREVFARPKPGVTGVWQRCHRALEAVTPGVIKRFDECHRSSQAIEK